MEAMRTARMTRVARGSAAATLATFVALLSHVAAGGAMPGWLGVAAPWMFSILVCVPLAGRRLSVLRVSAAVVVSQALFHVLFVLGSGSDTAIVGHALHAHHGVIALPASSDAVVLDVALTGDAVMWAAHGIAAILTVAALHRGERTLALLGRVARDVAAWLGRRTRILRAPARPVGAVPRPALDVVPVRPRRAVPLSAVVRRGPPPVCV